MAAENANVCVLMIDASEGITEQDEHIAGIAHEAKKGVIIVYNKWDLVEKDDKTMISIEKEIRKEEICVFQTRKFLIVEKRHVRRHLQH